MATFTISGYQIRSNSAHLVEEIQPSEMQLVAPLGMSTLACSYVENRPGNAEVALADYNLLLNGTHLNDGQLPDRIELFDLTWGTQGGNYISRVLNLAFKEADGWRDEVFAVDQSSLPSLVNAAQANAFLSASRFSLVDTSTSNGTFEIQLEQMPDVDVRGVLLKLFEAEDDADNFSFLQEFDTMPANVGFSEIAILEDDSISEALPSLEPSEYHSDQDADDNAPDPGLDEFSF